MQLPGIIEIAPDQSDLLTKAAKILGTSFLEELWFATWLSALDSLGADRARKETIMHAYFQTELELHAPYHAVYATDDMAAVAGGYLASEFADAPGHQALEAQAFEHALPAMLTEAEAQALDAASRHLEPVSDFFWAADHARADHAAGATATDDHVYFFAWAVDPDNRGSGAFRRLITPFFDRADELGVNCYLECYSDELQSLYEHVGFELVRTLDAPGVDIIERCMVRRPRQANAS